MAEIKKQMANGLFWSAINKYSGMGIKLVISMVLARLISPYDFGVVATASVLLAFLELFTSVGIGPAVIQRKDLNKSDLDNIFTFTIILGGVMAGISFASSWVIADFYDNDQLIPVVQVLSVGLLLSSLNIVPEALMSKNLRFKEVATRTILLQTLFGILGIVAAYKGLGVYALIFPQILTSFCVFFYNNHFFHVKISWKFDINPIKKIFSYSSYVFLSQVINYFSRNLDKILIGKYISADALGYYEKSYRLMQMPLMGVSSVIYPVMQPILSSFQNDMKEMARIYSKIIAKIACISFPIAAILYFSAEDIIVIMFGEMWLPAVPAFKILAISVPFNLICNPNGAVYLSCNASKQMFQFTIIGTVIIIVSFFISAFVFGTIESFAWSWTLNEIFAVFLSYYILFVKVMKESMTPVLKALVKPIIATVALSVLYILLFLFIPSNCNRIIRIVIELSMGGLFSLIFLQLSGQFDILSLAKKFVSRK